MDVKQDVFRKLDAIAKPGAILATNTSTLDVDQIAAVTKRPQDVIGTHFFSPANVMRLLEVVRGKKTDKGVLATTMKLGKALKKVPVVSGVCDGFIGNRMLEKYGQQSLFLLDEGASPQQVDAALAKFGMAMGPFTMYDMAGNDIGWEIRKRRYQERPDFVYSKIADRVCEQGRFGQKTGKGFYKYEAGNRKPIPDPEVDKIFDAYRKEIGVKPRTISDEEIVAAPDLRAGQRRRAHPRGRHRAARLRHRHGLPHRLRLPALPRRADVLRRHRRPRQGARRRSKAFRRATRATRGSPRRCSSNSPRKEGNSMMTEAVIVSTARTPLCKSWRGALNMTHGAKMGGHVVHAALERAKVDADEVEDVIIGCANPEGATGWNIARQIAIRAGCPVTVPGMTREPLLLLRACRPSRSPASESWPAKARCSSPAASSRSRWCRTR